jgi:tRNA pseudouridine(38-40) synthase
MVPFVERDTDSKGGGRSTVTRWLIRFGYDGSAFAGWARQPGRRTVEGEMLGGIARSGVVSRPEEAHLAVASRTDRGVSARGNALTLETELDGRALLGALNGVSAEIWFTAAAVVAPEFRVRGATRRVYRYFDRGPVRSLEVRASAARLFSGDVDVRSFGRGLPTGRSSRRAIESVSVTACGGGTRVEVRAPSFVWGEVRKIVSALREADAGRLSLASLRRALDGTERLSLPLAEPEPLVLWEVEYPVEWQVRWRGPNRRQSAHRRSERSRLWSRAHVLASIDDGIALLPPPNAYGDSVGEK